MEIQTSDIKLQLNSINFDKAKLFSTFILFIGIALIIADPFISDLSQPLFLYLHIAHWLTFATGLSMRLITFLAKSKEKGTLISFAFAMMIAVNGVFVSSIDVQLDRGIVAFLITTLCLSVLLYFNEILSIVISIVNYGLFCAVVILFEKNANHLTSYLINGSVFCFLSLFLFITTYKRKMKEIEQTLLIKNQQEAIERKNSTMLEVNKSLVQRNTQIMIQKEEILTQRDEIEAQRNMAESQRDTIFEQNKEIKDSINYAKRIQRAVFPPENCLNSFFPNNFIFFKPRDIVSGDFFWAKSITVFKPKNTDSYSILLFCVADCTGHGIPGAFMSILGITLLNEIINKISSENIEINAGIILDRLRDGIINALHQTESGNSKDGMDIAFCIFDSVKMEMQYAGANNSVLFVPSLSENIITKRSFPVNSESISSGIILKPDKMPIGFLDGTKKSFSNHRIQLQQNDMIYLFTDGYADQFGEENQKTFRSKNMYQLLEKNSHLPTDKQKEIIQNTLTEWQGKLDQIDDITIVGIRI